MVYHNENFISSLSLHIPPKINLLPAFIKRLSPRRWGHDKGCPNQTREELNTRWALIKDRLGKLELLILEKRRLPGNLRAPSSLGSFLGRGVLDKGLE